MKLLTLIAWAMSTEWAVTERMLRILCAVLAERAAGHRPDAAEIAARLEGHRAEPRAAVLTIPARAAAAGAAQPPGRAIRVIGLHGTIGPRAEQFADVSQSGTGLDRFRARVAEAVADPQIGTIVLDVDSPGGSVAGVPETASFIREHAKRKPIVAVANTLAASAAYWIAAQATELYASPSAEVGSIGVFTIHEDLSAALEMKGISPTVVSAGEFKAELAPFGPLSAEARAELQRRVDRTHDDFLADVARGRQVPKARVKSDFGRGRLVPADEAQASGMVDQVATLDQVVADLQAPRRRLGRRAAADPDARPRAGEARRRRLALS